MIDLLKYRYLYLLVSGIIIIPGLFFIAIGGLKPKALSARLLKTGQAVKFTQDEFSLRLTGLPIDPPDSPVSVIEVECDAEPVVNHAAMRPLWPRYKVGMSI